MKNTASGNGLALVRGQAIAWTDTDLILWHHMEWPGYNELMFPEQDREYFINNQVNAKPAPAVAPCVTMSWASKKQAELVWQ